MKKYILLFVMVLFPLSYAFLALGTELELKFVLEHSGVSEESLFDGARRIRTISSVQLALFLSMLAICLYLFITRNNRPPIDEEQDDQ